MARQLCLLSFMDAERRACEKRSVQSLCSEPDHGIGESFATLLEGGRFRLERISSFGAASEPGFWYDQELPEWVLLVRGSAAIEFEEGSLELSAGDHLTIAAHRKHRVARTSSDAVWLALHFEDGKGA